MGKSRLTLQAMGLPRPMVAKQVMHSSQGMISLFLPARIFPAVSGSAIIWRPIATISMDESCTASGATSPSARSGHPADDGNHHHSWYFSPQTELYYQTFGGTRKLFYTEMGYASQEGVPAFSDWFGWARGTNTAQQAAWLAEAVGLSINTGMVRCIIVWNIDFVRYGYDPQDTLSNVVVDIKISIFCVYI